MGRNPLIHQALRQIHIFQRPPPRRFAQVRVRLVAAIGVLVIELRDAKLIEPRTVFARVTRMDAIVFR